MGVRAVVFDLFITLTDWEAERRRPRFMAELAAALDVESGGVRIRDAGDIHRARRGCLSAPIPLHAEDRWTGRSISELQDVKRVLWELTNETA